MNPFEMVVLIVAIVMIAGVMRAKYGVDRHGWRNHADEGTTVRENAELRRELDRLKERLAVLERLATEDHESVRLDREIERLREPK